MKRLLVLFVLMLSTHLSHAVNYYISSVSGKDTNNGTSEDTPWKTIDKLNSMSSNLKPGDNVFFKRGETFYGTITVKVSGVSGKVIYYGAYGTGTNPVITGFVTLSKWTLHTTGIYYAAVDMPNLQMVTIDGVARGMGRFPNTGYFNYENHNGNKSITDNELPSSPSWTGAEVVIRKVRFILDRHTVTRHVGTTLNYSTSTTNGNNNAYNPVKGNGYFFQNHLGTLDQFGEWYYDSKAKRLYVFFGTAVPSGLVVKASTKENNITVSTLSYLKFENLDLEGANGKGLSLVNVSNTEVQACNFYNQGGSALYGIDLNYVKVTGGSINTSFSNGVFFEYNDNNCTIDGVTVRNTNTIAGTGRSGDAVGIGIMVYGNHSNIINNKVIGTGYNGIHFIGNHVLVDRNYIDNYCTVKDDGGGIYTFTGSSTTANVNRKIQNNIILNAVGAYAGAEAYHYEAFGKAAGIYLDDYANNLEVLNNVVANGDWAGFLLHNAHTNIYTGNIIYNHRFQVHVTQYAAATRNNTMTNNQYIAKQADQNTFYYRTYVTDDPSTMGVFDQNYYARPIDDNATIRIDNNFSGGNGTSYISLEQWKSSYQLDPSSEKSPVTYTSNINENIRFEYNETPADKTVNLDGGYVDVKRKEYSGSITLPPFSGLVLLKKLNQTITFPAIPNKTVGDPPFTLEATSSSGLPISYRVVSGAEIVKIEGNTVSLTGEVGKVTIEASQAGNEIYNAAAPVSQSFEVSQPTTSTVTVKEEASESTLPQRDVQLSVLPNPMQQQGLIRVQTIESTAGILAVFNSAGMEVKQLGYRRFEKNHPTLIELNMQGLISGTYIIRLATNKGTISKLFVLK